MKTVGLIFVCVLAVSVLVTSQHYKYAKNATNPAQDCVGAATTGVNAPKPNPDNQNSKWKSPGWDLVFLIFGWPSGVTVCALFLTMMVITEQTRHTAKAAKATED